jgi:sugar transferase (PEP-CTERM/EpsH1 system associated)
MSTRPLIVHLTYVFDFGGLETLIVELINRMPVDSYRHVIVCLTRYTDFVKKIERPDIEIYALGKPPGLAPEVHVKLWKLLRQLRPDVLHTYNLATLEYGATALLAGVPVRIHAEHGRDAGDPDGSNRKHNLLRRLMAPVVDTYIPVSGDLRSWLRNKVGIPDAKNLLIDNGVDTGRFTPGPRSPLPGMPDFGACFVIGTVGRMQQVKDHANLIDAFIALRERLPEQRARLRLVIAGDGPLYASIAARVEAAGLGDSVWLPGARNDIPELLRSFDVFALSSIAEGTPVALLEAMASGVPVVSTRVGGVPELVVENETGLLAPARDAQALADALAVYVTQPALREQHGRASRERVEACYSIANMVKSYTALYDRLCKDKLKRPAAQPAVHKEPVQ